MTDAQTLPSAPAPLAAPPDAPTPLTERPEVLAAAAFGGGFLLAMLLKRLG